MRSLQIAVALCIGFFIAPSSSFAYWAFQRCQQAGGSWQDGSCHCIPGGPALNLATDTCAATALKQMENINSKADCVCSMAPARNSANTRVQIEELCRAPAQYLCDPDLNKSETKIAQVSQLLAKTKRQIDSEDVPQDLIQHCAKQDAECLEYNKNQYREALAKLNTHNALAKSHQIFNKAKTDLLAYLYGLQKKSSNPQEISLIIKKIKPAHLQDPQSAPNPEDFFDLHAEPGGLAHGREQPIPNSVFLLATASPQALRFAYLHELSHRAGFSPAGLNKEKDHPFLPLVECFRRSDTAKVPKADKSCFEKKIEAVVSSNADKSCVNEYQNFIELLSARSEGISAPTCAEPLEPYCANPKADETLSDWLATEVYFTKPSHPSDNHDQLIDVKQWAQKHPDLMDFIAVECFSENQVLSGISGNKDTEGILNLVSQLDTHLRSSRRIDVVLARHPGFQRALGCGEHAATAIRDVHQPVTESMNAYCSPELLSKTQP